MKKSDNTGLILGTCCFMFLDISICIISVALFVLSCDTIRDLNKVGLPVPTETTLLVILFALVAIFCVYLSFVCTWFLFDKIKTNKAVSLLLSNKCPHCRAPIEDDSAVFCQNCGQQLIKENKTEKAE